MTQYKPPPPKYSIVEAAYKVEKAAKEQKDEETEVQLLKNKIVELGDKVSQLEAENERLKTEVRSKYDGFYSYNNNE